MVKDKILGGGGGGGGGRGDNNIDVKISSKSQ